MKIRKTKSTTFFTKYGFYYDTEMKTLVILLGIKRIYISRK